MSLDKETGLVVHDDEKCIVCWTCIIACPYGAIKPDLSGKIVAKCDLCPNLEVPACVANCPNEALTYEEVEQ
jgi:carbon-monoxide dehydrogenase iron sulfur subunit